VKKVLILGGNGYVGSSLRKHLADKYEITSVDTCWFTDPLPGTIVEDFNNLPQEFYYSYDVIVLLAGHSSVKMCEGPVEYAYKNNVTNFLNLLAKIKPHQKFIYASSSSVYGDAGEKLVDETYATFNPHNHYDVTKHIIDLYAQRSEVQYYGLRFGTVNGYSPITRSDVMINSMVHSAQTTGEIKLYIKDILRPILGILDLVRAVEHIIETPKDLRGIYNLASFNSTAEEIAYQVSKVTGKLVKEYSTDPLNIINSKLQTKTYNFSIDCTKFEQLFNFKFEETVNTIAEQLLNNFESIIFTNRNYVKDYE